MLNFYSLWSSLDDMKNSFIFIMPFRCIEITIRFIEMLFRLLEILFVHFEIHILYFFATIDFFLYGHSTSSQWVESWQNSNGKECVEFWPQHMLINLEQIVNLIEITYTINFVLVCLLALIHVTYDQIQADGHFLAANFLAVTFQQPLSFFLFFLA